MSKRSLVSMSGISYFTLILHFSTLSQDQYKGNLSAAAHALIKVIFCCDCFLRLAISLINRYQHYYPKRKTHSSLKNSSTQSMSKWVMLYRTPFDKTQFLEISRCWRELRALPAQLDIPANHRPLLGKSWRGGRKSRHGLRTAFHTVTTTEDDFSLYFLSNGTPATPWWWFQVSLLESKKTSAEYKRFCTSAHPK